MEQANLDFAISYAGENLEIAKEIFQRLTELEFSVFFAESQREHLVGLDGEKFFEELFATSKQVIVLISEAYKKKEWTRFEWDVIKERRLINRFIPIRIDKTKILGLSSNIFYLSFSENNYDEIIRSCVMRLIKYEQEQGIKRPTQFDQILSTLKNDSKGSLAKAFQLVKDNKKREQPLSDCQVPSENYGTSYEVIDTGWSNYSVVKRLAVKIIVPKRLSRDELRFNLMHCSATQFNKFKPDAISTLAYTKSENGDSIDGAFTAGKIDFAPFGKWEKAEEGVAYNIPVEEFDYSIQYASDYVFD